MRFTLHLTACLATFVVAAHALAGPGDDERSAQKPACSADGGLDLGSMLYEAVMAAEIEEGTGLSPLQEAQMVYMVKSGLDDARAIKTCEDENIRLEGFPFKSYSKLLGKEDAAASKLLGKEDAAALETNWVQYGILQNDYIVGVTQDGATMTIHCNPGNCTVGSLNRFSVLTGAPMMIPKALRDQARDKIGREKLDDSGVWKTVASVIWSDPKRLTKITETLDDALKPDVEVTYKLEPDVNAIRARKIYEKSPEAYKSKQEAFKKSLNTGDKFVLNTKGVVSTDFSADVEVVADGDEVVVTETVVTCTSQGQTDCVDAHDQ